MTYPDRRVQVGHSHLLRTLHGLDHLLLVLRGEKSASAPGDAPADSCSEQGCGSLVSSGNGAKPAPPARPKVQGLSPPAGTLPVPRRSSAHPVGARGLTHLLRQERDELGADHIEPLRDLRLAAEERQCPSGQGAELPPCQAAPNTAGDPSRQGRSPGRQTPPPHRHPSSHRVLALGPKSCCSAPRSRNTVVGTRKALLPNATPSKNTSPASSVPTLRALGWLLPPPCQGHGARWPMPPRAIPKQAPSPAGQGPSRLPSALRTASCRHHDC